jgi:hypothetical protein
VAIQRAESSRQSDERTEFGTKVQGKRFVSERGTHMGLERFPLPFFQLPRRGPRFSVPAALNREHFFPLIEVCNLAGLSCVPSV